MVCSERRKEINRRRHRRKKLAKLAARAEKAAVSEKQHIATINPDLTPGAPGISEVVGLEQR